MPQCTDCVPHIAIWYQPVSKMDQWVACGINTLIGIEREGGRYTQAFVRAQAASKGLKYIDVPSADIAADNADPNLVAFLQPDEPDFRRQPLSSWADRFTAVKAVSNKPVFGNFSGPHVTAAFPWYKGTPSQTWAGHKAFIPYADWLCHDWYPINTEPSRYWTPFDGPGLITRAMDLLNTWSNGKPQMAFVECSWINKSAAGPDGPTPDQMEQIVRAIWNHPSAIGWAFFPQRDAVNNRTPTSSFTFDNTTPTMRTRMTEVNASLQPVAVARQPLYTLYDDGTWEAV